MTRWDALTIAGGLVLALGAWWIYPPAAAVVLGIEAVVLGMTMDARKDGNKP